VGVGAGVGLGAAVAVAPVPVSAGTATSLNNKSNVDRLEKQVQQLKDKLPTPKSGPIDGRGTNPATAPN